MTDTLVNPTLDAPAPDAPAPKASKAAKTPKASKAASVPTLDAVKAAKAVLTAARAAGVVDRGRGRQFDPSRVITILGDAATLNPGRQAGYRVLDGLKARRGLKVKASAFFDTARRLGVPFDQSFFRVWASRGHIVDPAYPTRVKPL